MTTSIVKAPENTGALSFEDKTKQLLRQLATVLSDAELAPAQLTMTYNAIKDWKENLVSLEENAKKRLLALVTQHGAAISAAGTKRTVLDGWVLEARPNGAIWDEKKVMALLRGKKLALDKYMTPTVQYKVDETKLGVLVELGKLSEAEVKACKKTRSLTLQPPHLLADEEDES